MNRPRYIPVLLVKGGRLVKSVRFRGHQYVGDPLNAARIFNDLEVDELVLLDIDASRERRCISSEFVVNIAEELTAPLSVGGGIATLDGISQVIACGVEKVVIGTAAVRDPGFVVEAAKEFGTSTISVCIDVDARRQVKYLNATKCGAFDAVDFAKRVADAGAGEIILQSIERDGTFAGYDTALVREVSDAVRIPVVALGGAASEPDLEAIVAGSHASAAAAGSTFIYRDADRGVLINYPPRSASHL